MRPRVTQELRGLGRCQTEQKLSRLRWRQRRKLVGMVGAVAGATGAGVEPSKEQEYTLRRSNTKHGLLLLLLILVELFSNTEGKYVGPGQTSRYTIELLRRSKLLLNTFRM